MGQGKTGTLLDTGVGNTYPFERLSFRDCWLHDSLLTLSPSGGSSVTSAVTNNIIERCKLTISRGSTTPYSVYFYNNLFLYDPSPISGTAQALSLNYTSGGSNPFWEIHDNLFDGSSQTVSGDLASIHVSNNGFTGTTVNSLGGSDVHGLNVDYQINGPLGKYYYPATGTYPSLAALIGAGSRNADVAG